MAYGKVTLANGERGLFCGPYRFRYMYQNYRARLAWVCAGQGLLGRRCYARMWTTPSPQFDYVEVDGLHSCRVNRPGERFCIVYINMVKKKMGFNFVLPN